MGVRSVEDLVDFILTKKKWVLHVLYWLTILVFYVIFFGRRYSNYWQTFVFVSLLMPVTIGITYFLNYNLVPRYLMTGRVFQFLLYFIYALIIAVFLEMMISLLTFLVVARVNVQSMDPASFDLVFILTSLLMVVFSGVFIKMARHWSHSRDQYQRLMREKVETELSLLKTQLNPHFLFNTLNNLYYLATEKSDQAPKAILALSEMLDYVMHSGTRLTVSLQEEIKQMQNYIELEMLRYNDRVKVSVDVTGDTSRHSAPPMLLITLIENSFKHGVRPTSGEAWIRVIVKCDLTGWEVDIRNNRKGSAGGHQIGLRNLQQQLTHIYKESYRLHVDAASAEEFGVRLEVTQSA